MHWLREGGEDTSDSRIDPSPRFDDDQPSAAQRQPQRGSAAGGGEVVR